MCDLSEGQTGEGHRGEESVCAAVNQGERCVLHSSLRQHQSIIKQEQAHIRHMLVGPNHAFTQTEGRSFDETLIL